MKISKWGYQCDRSGKNAIGSVIEGAWQAIQGWFSKFTDAGANIVGMIADGITGAIGKAKEAIDGVVSKIRNFTIFTKEKKVPYLICIN